LRIHSWSLQQLESIQEDELKEGIEEFEMEFKTPTPSLDSPFEEGDWKKRRNICCVKEPLVQGATNIMSKVKIGEIWYTWYQEGSLWGCQTSPLFKGRSRKAWYQWKDNYVQDIITQEVWNFASVTWRWGQARQYEQPWSSNPEVKVQHFKYTLRDFFTIIIPNDDEMIEWTIDMYTDHSNITIEQVAPF
jgi:hypothetical protein